MLQVYYIIIEKQRLTRSNQLYVLPYIMSLIYIHIIYIYISLCRFGCVGECFHPTLRFLCLKGSKYGYCISRGRIRLLPIKRYLQYDTKVYQMVRLHQKRSGKSWKPVSVPLLPVSTLTQSDNTCSMDGSNRSVIERWIFDKTVCKKLLRNKYTEYTNM